MPSHSVPHTAGCRDEAAGAGAHSDRTQLGHRAPCALRRRFSRARLTPDPQATGYSAATLRDVLAEGDPAIVVRAHHADEGYINVDAIEMTDDEIEYVCAEVKRLLSNDH